MKTQPNLRKQFEAHHIFEDMLEILDLDEGKLLKISTVWRMTQANLFQMRSIPLYELSIRYSTFWDFTYIVHGSFSEVLKFELLCRYCHFSCVICHII